MPRPHRMFSITVAVLLATVAVSCGGDDDAETTTPASEAVASTALAARSPSTTTAVSDGPTSSTSASETTEDVTIVFESYNYGTQGVGGEGTQQLIDEFEAAHPSIHIEPVGTPAAEIHTSVQAKAAAGEPPDVAQIGWSKFAFVLENLPYVPFEEVAPAGELDAHLAGMAPAAVSMGELDGHLIGIPYTVSTPTMLINADLFREAGLDPAQPPATWAAAKEAAQAIVDSGAQGIYVDAAGDAKSDFLTQTLINSNGGSVMDAEGNVTFDSPEAVEALAMLSDLTDSGAQPPVSESEAVALFEAGQLGMLVTSTALLAGLVSSTADQFELTTGGIPAFGTKPIGPTVSGAGVFVFSEDPAKRAAAWELVKFLTGDRGETIVTSKIGYLPMRPGLVDDPNALAPYFAEDPRLLPALQQLDHLVPYQVFPGPDGTRATQTLQDDAVAPIMLSGADPESTLAAVADEVRSLLGQ